MSSIEDLQLLLEIKEDAFYNYLEINEEEIRKFENNITQLKEEIDLKKLSLLAAKEETAHAYGDKDKIAADLEARADVWTAERKDLKKQLTEQRSEASSAEEKFLKRIGNLKGNLERTTSEMKTRSDEFEDTRKGLTEKLLELNCANETLLKQIEKLTNELDTKDGNLQTMQLRIDALEKLLQVKQNIEDEVDVSQITKKKVIAIGLSTLRSGMGKTMTVGVAKELQIRLQDRLARENRDVQIKHCQTLDDVTDGPLLVLCLAKSIIGTKIDALEGVQVNKDTMLIIIHYTDTTDDPPTLHRTQNLRHFKEVRQLGGTADMIFSNGRGLFECDVNIAAVEALTAFLKTFKCKITSIL